VRIFQYLAPAAFAGSLNPTGWAWISLNQTDRLLRWSLISTPIVVASFAAGVPYGPEGVAIAFSVVQMSLRYFGVQYCFSGNFLSFGILTSAVWQPTVASLAAGLLVWGGALLLSPPLASWLMLLVKCGGYALAYLGVWLLLPGGARALRETAALIRELRSKSPPHTEIPS
jgi:PST family polysaccharide transporter